MKAFVLKKTVDLSTNFNPLELVEMPIPIPLSDEILIKVSCCGICHTELDEIEGRMPPSLSPIVPGHQIIGHVELTGINARRFHKGQRVGVSWIYSSCGSCHYCRNGFENLCPNFRGTGRDANGGYAEYMVVSEKFAFLIPNSLSDIEAAPLLCAGAIGYRALQLSQIKNGQTLGLTGFGASGHLVLKMARYLFPQSDIYVFARSYSERAFALGLGAAWVGNISDVSPSKVHAIIDTTPAWKTIVDSLEHLEPGGKLVINAIRKEENDKNELLKLSYQKHFWMEKEIKSVANVTRDDVTELLELASAFPIFPQVETYPFEKINSALLELKNKPVKGAKVLIINGKTEI